jgi:UDP-2-acetamido-3-amino-2,3-dideoxy-glucuronate N-acetyltransferase
MQELKTIKDERGVLMVIDHSEIPFEVNRTFFINSVPDGHARGNHAHKECHQFIVCLSHIVHISLESKNRLFPDMEHIVSLVAGQSIYIPPLTWVDIVFTEDASICVMCSHPYSIDDYITDRNLFLSL